MILDHLKRFQISATGGLMLTKDLALYQDTVASLGLAPLNDRFEMLRQLGNVFIVQPDILKSYLTESYLARIENRLLRPFVMMRTDFSDHSRKFWDDVFGPDGGVDGGTAAGGHAHTGFGRGHSLGGVGHAWGGMARGGGGSGQGSPSLGASSPAVGGTQPLRTQRNASLFGLGGLMKEFEGMGLSEGGRTSFAAGSER